MGKNLQIYLHYSFSQNRLILGALVLKKIIIKYYVPNMKPRQVLAIWFNANSCWIRLMSAPDMGSFRKVYLSLLYFCYYHLFSSGIAITLVIIYYAIILGHLIYRSILQILLLLSATLLHGFLFFTYIR